MKATATHELQFKALCDYFVGHADTEATRTVEAHLAVCISCRESLRVMALLAGTPAEELSSSGGDHPTLEELVRFFRDQPALDSIRAARISSHLAECDDCESELQFLRKLESDVQRALSGGEQP